MAAPPSHALKLAQFESQFGQEKPHYEYWYGEAVQKSMPTWIHGLLQRIVMELLREAGYKAASEVKLKIDAEFHPVPDIIATAGPIERPYPIKPIEIVVEILSDDDSMARLLIKCRNYQTWGIQEIYVVDPSARLVFRWSEYCLEEVQLMAGRPVEDLWGMLDQEIN